MPSRYVLAACLLLAAPALAEDQPDYLDDRSAPEAVVRSFYNAITLKQYARAYGYYDAGQGAGEYRSFADGYADTRSVEVTTGEAAGEGAAGSTYFSLPVSIEATRTDGTIQDFAGCYTLRLINPAIQEPPVKPMFIVSGKMHRAAGYGEAYLPAGCGP
jgi:hypothetical protein